MPTNVSLIESTHQLADFIEPVYEELKKEITESKVLHADETPHRMLEGDKDKKTYYLWGFSNEKSSYFEIRGTRSGEVASNMLTDSKCEFLVSDVFSGYKKCVNESNKVRSEQNLPVISNIYCNAHARRKFKESELNFAEAATFFIDGYRKIYQLEAGLKEKPGIALENRLKMEPYFLAMKARAIELMDEYPKKSSMGIAIRCFLKNYEGLTRFLKNIALPIDNNAQERLMRNPVIGRKTWYGTHSKRGAKTTAIMFSVVESCKMNKINPRQYLKSLVTALHQGRPHFTPAQFKMN